MTSAPVATTPAFDGGAAGAGRLGPPPTAPTSDGSDSAQGRAPSSFERILSGDHGTTRAGRASRDAGDHDHVHHDAARTSGETGAGTAEVPVAGPPPQGSDAALALAAAPPGSPATTDGATIGQPAPGSEAGSVSGMPTDGETLARGVVPDAGSVDVVSWADAVDSRTTPGTGTPALGATGTGAEGPVAASPSGASVTGAGAGPVTTAPGTVLASTAASTSVPPGGPRDPASTPSEAAPTGSATRAGPGNAGPAHAGATTGTPPGAAPATAHAPATEAPRPDAPRPATSDTSAGVTAPVTGADTSDPKADDGSGAVRAGDVVLDTAPLTTSISGMLNRGNGTSSVLLNLHPPELGQVQARLSLRGDLLQVELSPEHAAAHDALESALPSLRQHLAQQGVEVDVTLGDPGAAGQGGRHEGEAGQGSARDAAPASAAGDAEAPEAALSPLATGSEGAPPGSSDNHLHLVL